MQITPKDHQIYLIKYSITISLMISSLTSKEKKSQIFIDMQFKMTDLKKRKILYVKNRLLSTF